MMRVFSSTIALATRSIASCAVRFGRYPYPLETHTTTRETRTAARPAPRSGAGLAEVAPHAAGHGEKPCRNTPLGAGQEIGDETPRSTESPPACGQDRMD